MAAINPGDFGAFFDTVSPAIEVNIYIVDMLWYQR